MLPTLTITYEKIGEDGIQALFSEKFNGSVLITIVLLSTSMNLTCTF